MLNAIADPAMVLRCMAVVLLTLISSSVFGGRAIPDPCKLITVAELEEIVGKISKGPKPAEPGSEEVSCEYTVAKDSSWLMINLHEGDFELMRKSLGGKAPVAVPELSKQAFLNESYEDFSAELFVKKGDLTLRVSMPKGPSTADKIKAIAKKALPRL
jgi:hypothetical protein